MLESETLERPEAESQILTFIKLQMQGQDSPIGNPPAVDVYSKIYWKKSYSSAIKPLKTSFQHLNRFDTLRSQVSNCDITNMIYKKAPYDS